MATGVKVIQCVAFDASDAFINNRGQYADAFAKIASVEGHLGLVNFGIVLHILCTDPPVAVS